MASVPFAFECDKASGFIMDPNVFKRVGYITDFHGLGMNTPLPKDLTITLPHTGKAPTYQGITPVRSSAPGLNTAKVVGVLEKFEWDGSVGGALKLDFWVSQANATQIKTLQQMALKTTKIDSLAWWILGYDQETKQWYEAAYPQSSRAVTGIVANKENPELNVDLTGAPVKEGIDVMVYKVSLAVVPGANQQYALSFANSSTKRVAKQWGLIVGKLASGQINPTV
jgi:hypothetical protein